MFSVEGYSKDWWVGGKYTGSTTIEKMDRKEFGYYGRENHTTEKEIVLNNKRKIRKGIKVMTELFPINGRIV